MLNSHRFISRTLFVISFSAFIISGASALNLTEGAAKAAKTEPKILAQVEVVGEGSFICSPAGSGKKAVCYKNPS